nr:PREDICTED: putative F-box/kelch-repeat protein At1g20790 [Nicotiana tabacum]
MELNDDLVVEIISYLPLKLAVQCKVLSKNFNTRISDLKFSQIWFPHQKISSTLFVYHSYGPNRVHKISINPPFPTTHSEMFLLPDHSSVLASCRGLLLLVFLKFRNFCVFNPITGAHQLISYPKPIHEFMKFRGIGLAVDYPTSDQYKLVIVGKLAEQQGYKFYVFSSERSGLWHEVRFRVNFINLAQCTKPVYVNDSLHWLRSDGSVLAFNTKREEAIILDLPAFFSHHAPIYGKLYPGFDTWLGMAQGLLTLVCKFRKSTVIAAYDYVTSNWRVSHTLDNFMGIPVWIDSKHVLFLEGSYTKQHRYLYVYDSENNGYKLADILNQNYIINNDMCSFQPTLASVQTTRLDTLSDEHLPVITATLDELRQFITIDNQ